MADPVEAVPFTLPDLRKTQVGTMVDKLGQRVKMPLAEAAPVPLCEFCSAGIEVVPLADPVEAVPFALPDLRKTQVGTMVDKLGQRVKMPSELAPVPHCEFCSAGIEAPWFALPDLRIAHAGTMVNKLGECTYPPAELVEARWFALDKLGQRVDVPTEPIEAVPFALPDLRKAQVGTMVDKLGQRMYPS